MHTLKLFFLMVMVPIIIVSLTGCGKKEGEIELLSKQNCVRKVEGHIFLSKPAGQYIKEDVRKAIDSAFGRQEQKSVLWVHLDVNISDLFKFLREQDPKIESFKKEDFRGLVRDAALIPIAPDGIVSVEDGVRFLQQDLIFLLPEGVKEFEIVIGRRSLAKFKLK